MISEKRLEEIVATALQDGKNASQIARRTGIPIERIQPMVHRLNGRDPGEAHKASRKSHRKDEKRLWGTTLSGPRQLGPNRRRGQRGS